MVNVTVRLPIENGIYHVGKMAEGEKKTFLKESEDGVTVHFSVILFLTSTEKF